MVEYALRVAPLRTEEVMLEARKRGVYDETRSVRMRDGRTEIPVEEPFGGYEVIEQDEPRRRKTSLEDLVDDPPDWSLVGDIALVRFGDSDDDERRDIANALMDLHDVRAVLDDRGIDGEGRVPRAERVLGDRDTETVHRENGFEFALDPGRTMFSLGNAAERVGVRDAVSEGERVLDMFAGIGYFAVPAAVGGASVVAVERRRVAYEYLIENAGRNGVADRIDARHGDCRDFEADEAFDRVLMGHFEASSDDFLSHAFDCVRNRGLVHVHDAVHAESYGEAARRVEEAARRSGCEVDTDVRRVKGYAEGVDHVVVDARLVD